MESELKTMKLRIGGMSCVSCQNKIERKLESTRGIPFAQVNYNNQTAVVTYDANIITVSDIEAVIESLDYKIIKDNQPEQNKKAVGVFIIVLSAYMLMQQLGLTEVFNIFPTAEVGTSYWMLFVIGLLTSVHCVAMCGGINLSQCISQTGLDKNNKLAALRPSFLYNLGRVIAYTAVGGIVGALGTVLTLTGAFRGMIQLFAGVFMVIMGINMLGVFPWMRKLMPRMPRIFTQKINSQKSKSKNPLIVGLLNGLMPCGPLQAMQIYALSTGSAINGAFSMFLFSLGTVPLMFGLGALSSVLTKKFTGKVMTVGATLVVVLGLSMFSNGWSLSGFSINLLPLSADNEASQINESKSVIKDGYQIVNSTLASGRYPAITVQEGIPVKWTIDAPEGSINGCNNRMIIPEYNIEYKFKTGENIIEFTPTKTGKFSYSCWMGMICSDISVVEESSELKEKTSSGVDKEIEPTLDNVVSNQQNSTFFEKDSGTFSCH